MLLRALAVIAVLAACALAIFAAVPELLLRTAFGADYESGANVLLQLGAAYALLAVSYLCVQFLLGLHRRAFVLVLAVMAVAEPLLLHRRGRPRGVRRHRPARAGRHGRRCCSP